MFGASREQWVGRVGGGLHEDRYEHLGTLLPPPRLGGLEGMGEGQGLRLKGNGPAGTRGPSRRTAPAVGRGHRERAEVPGPWWG